MQETDFVGNPQAMLVTKAALDTTVNFFYRLLCMLW
jgi:hypothetical protein